MVEKIEELNKRISESSEWLLNTPGGEVTKLDCIDILLNAVEVLLRLRAEHFFLSSEQEKSWADIVDERFIKNHNSFFNSLNLVCNQISKIQKERKYYAS